MKLIFVSNPTVGHTTFLISLADYAKKIGVEVLFLLPGVKSELLKKIIDNPILNIDLKLKSKNIPYKLIPFSISQGILAGSLESKRGADEVLHALKIFSAGANHYTKYLIKECVMEKPDAIIYDYTFFPAVAASESLQIPRVAIYHSGLPFLEYPIPLIGTSNKYGEVDERALKINSALFLKQEKKTKIKYEKVIGRDIKTNLLLSANSDFLNIITTIIEAEYPRKNLPNTVHFVGPSIFGYVENNEKPFFEKRNKKLIYISLGTVFNKQLDLFLRIINSITIPETEVLVAAGGSYKKLLRYTFRNNVHIEKFVPQLNVLSYTDVFITHGGKNSINESLKFGVPMILFPAGGEQEYNANLVEFLNAGKNFSQIQTTFSSNDMQYSLKFLMEDALVKYSIDSIAKKHNNIDGAKKAMSLIMDKLNKS